MGARPSVVLALHRAEVWRIAEAHRTRNPRIFGSVARSADTEASDLDLLVDITDRTSLFDIAAIELDLEALLSVPVHVTTADVLHGALWEKVLTEAEAV